MPLLATLNNVTTANGYTPAATAQVPSRFDIATDASITITGAAVYMQIAEIGKGPIAAQGAWGIEEFVPPKMIEMSEARIGGIRFRSAVAGTPAQVTCSLNA